MITGEPLSIDSLANSKSLPVKPSAVTLTGQFVKLVPLELERDVPVLFKISNGNAVHLGEKLVEEYDPDSVIWRYMSAGPFENEAALRAFLQPQVEVENGLCYCVFDTAFDHQLGVATYMNNFPAHLKVELGNIWYSPLAQRTKANLEATYLMLRHVFDLGYRRVEWKCDSLNERSRRAALRMGFKFEGIQEQHFIIKGRNRDTAWYRILDGEWNEVKGHLENLLANSR
jgi:RimJ/RimL family protein N-acetyltransferase